MVIQLSEHFSYKKILRFTFPSIVMMIFTSIYSVVDGLFVSNFAGKTPFAALNLIYPYIMILGTVGLMFGTGGCALVSKIMGEGDREKAHRTFSLIVCASILCGLILTIVGYVSLRPVAILMGAQGEMLEYCVAYGRILIIAMIPFVLQMEFQSFFVAAERPQLGLFITLGAGVTNIVLDAIIVGVLNGGLVGAAIATAISQLVGGIVPLLYFLLPNKSALRMRRPILNIKALGKTCTNGASELMTNISMSLVSMLYNIQLMKFAGEDGVAAYGVLMYVNFVFVAAFIGYSMGSAPIVSYHYGAENHGELKNVLNKSIVIIAIFSAVMITLGEVLAYPLSALFVGYDQTLFELTLRGFRIFSLSFFFAGMAVYGSSFFTALNNGIISATISFLRTLVFQIGAVMLLPLILGIDGIWFSIVVAELMAFVIAILFIVAKRKKYHYW